jgi:NAD(P)-dependent dehydrogenase (short-subunit alcohol dehydrogenase family)
MVAMQAAFPFMKEHGGSIINFGSGRGTLATPGTAAYNVTKEAVRTLSRSAANEWGQYGIRVNIMSPIIATDSFYTDMADPDARQALINAIPLRFVGDAREAGRVAVFLAGPDSRYMTGHTFMVDGGYTPRV